MHSPVRLLAVTEHCGNPHPAYGFLTKTPCGVCLQAMLQCHEAARQHIASRATHVIFGLASPSWPPAVVATAAAMAVEIAASLSAQQLIMQTPVKVKQMMQAQVQAALTTHRKQLRQLQAANENRQNAEVE